MPEFSLRALVEPETDEQQLETEVTDEVEEALEDIEFTPSAEMDGAMPSAASMGDGSMGDGASDIAQAGVAGRAARGGGLLGGLGGLVSGGALTVALGGVIGIGILKKLEDVSPALQQGFGLIGEAFRLFWRPFGNALAKKIFPMAEGLIQFAADFNELYADEGLVEALKNLPEMISQNADFGELKTSIEVGVDNVVDGFQEVLSDWIGDLGGSIGLPEGGVRGAARGLMEGVEFGTENFGPLGTIFGTPLFSALGGVLGATGTDTEAFFEELEGFDIQDAVGEIDFSFIEDNWPGWPDIGASWPGWPSIDAEWPGWPNLSIPTGFWPDLSVPASFWPNLQVPDNLWPNLQVPDSLWPNISKSDIMNALFGGIDIGQGDIIGGGDGGGGTGGGGGGGGILPGGFDDIPWLTPPPLPTDDIWRGLSDTTGRNDFDRGRFNNRGRTNRFGTLDRRDRQENLLEDIQQTIDEGLNLVSSELANMRFDTDVQVDGRTIVRQTDKSKRRYRSRREVLR